MRPFSILATLLGAALLFLVQPMVARLALPFLGGAPAVWTTSALFFQILLLLGYLYAHLLSSWLKPRRAALLHMSLLAVSMGFLPVRWAPGFPPEASPVSWLLGHLTATVGLPFFLLSATGPLIQRWLYASRRPGTGDPYPLYAVSNAGSLVGLLSYPLVVEPFLPLRAPSPSLSQIHLWSAGYLGFVLLAAFCAVLALRTADAGGRDQIPLPSSPAAMQRSGRLRWILFSFVPASGLLAVTHHISTDLAVFPLLWILPLALYLATFVLAFAARGPLLLSWSSTGLAVTAVGVVASLWAFERPYTWVLLVLHPMALFFLAMVCHGRLARDRPEPARLTEFYLCVATGGALGGAFNTLVAPRVFASVEEYPLVLLLACLLRPRGSTAAPGRRERRARVLDLAWPLALLFFVAMVPRAAILLGVKSAAAGLVLQVAAPCALAMFFLRRSLRFTLCLAVLLAAAWVEARPSGQLLHARRDFFGVHRVFLRDGPVLEGIDASGRKTFVSYPFHVLYHGTTRHGSQALTERLRMTPTSYYHPTGPLGEVLRALEDGHRLDRVAVVGLGAGAVAGYGREGRRITFYEIDPEVVRIARDERLFTYLRDARGEVDIAVGDGRLLLSRAPDSLYGLIVLDAFSSDAVPVHLMTQEAVELYFRKLRPDGLLAAHLTNQHLDLEVVFHAIAAGAGLVGASRSDEVASLQQMLEGKDRSQWVVLARDLSALGPLASDPEWLRVPVPGVPIDPRLLWTDDTSSVLSVLRFW